MRATLINANVFLNDGFEKTSVCIDGGSIVSIGGSLAGSEIINLDNCYIFPGFADVHVHLREPGFSYKETIKTGTEASAKGGYTAVCSMPNLNPVPDSAENIQKQIDIIDRDAVIKVFPYGAITVGEKGEELSDMDALAKMCVAFSDDGKGVQSEAMMRKAMENAARLDKIIAAHCEAESLLGGSAIREGEYSRSHGMHGINPESEWMPLKRDIELLAQTGAKYHMCHVSTAESVELIRNAKMRGIDITAETGPHYLILTEDDLQDEGRFKMNPPLGSKRDRDALIRGICDGTIDMIATDHAPHSAEEKSKGLSGSLMGITGIETAFPLLYTHLVLTGKLTLEALVKLLSVNPNKRFLLGGGVIKEGAPADLTVFNLDEKYRINSAEFISMGKSTPFENYEVWGKCIMTLSDGEIVWRSI